MTMSPEHAAQAMRRFASSLPAAVARPMEDSGKRAESLAERNFRTKSPGRSIFAAKASASTPRLILDSRARNVQGVVALELILKGMAALIEEGGRTKPKTIRPVGKKFLRFHGQTGEVFAKSVRHLGSRIQKAEHGQRAMEELARELPRSIDAAIQGAVRANGL